MKQTKDPHYLKYYLKENSDYGKPKGEFIPPTEEDYKFIMGHVEPHKQIKTYEEYVERKKAKHEKEELQLLTDKVAIDRTEETETIKEIEKSEGFVRWIT